MSRFALGVSMVLGLVPVGCGDDIPLGTDDGTAGPSTGDGSVTTSSPASTDMSPADDSTSGDPTTPATDSTGPAGTCGNGELEADEECDDANTEDGDACYANCTLPFVEQWTLSLHGGSAGDWFDDVVLDREGNAYVVGSAMADDGDQDLWLVQILPDGRTGWTFTYNGARDGDDWGSALGWIGDDLVIAGTEQRTLGYDGLVLRVGVGDTEPVWAVQIDGPSDQEAGENFDQVFVDPDGSILVGGALTVDASRDAAVARLDADGGVTWQVTFGGPDDHESITGLVVQPGAEILAAGMVIQAGQSADAWLRRLSDTGTELELVSLPYDAHDLAIDARGSVAIVGRTRPGDGTAPQAVLELRDPALAALWMHVYEGRTQGLDQFYDVAFLSDGDLVVTGGHSILGEALDIVTGRWSAEGQRLWVDTHGAPLQLDDQGYGIAVTAAGDVIVVGSEVVFGESGNGWARRLSQGTPP